MKSQYSFSIAITLIFSLIDYAKSDCAFMQNKDGTLQAVDEEHRKPIISKAPLCAEYSEPTSVCCTPEQAQTLESNFVSLESIFGTAVGGCDICVANLKKFWCHFTCHPEQASFISVIGLREHKIGKETKILLDMNFTLNEDMNCELFQSCKKTKFAAQVPAMSNAIGFMNFQGVNAYTKTPAFIQILTSKEGGLKYPIRPCEYDPKDKIVDGIPIKEFCTCNSCAKRCDFSLTSQTPVMEGLNGIVIICFYGFVVVATICIFYFKNYYSNKKEGQIHPENLF